MAQLIFCNKLKKQAPGLDSQPIPGALGLRIFQEISKEAWLDWIAHQTMLINEYRLNLMDPDARKFLKTEMEKYFFGEGSDKPQGFNPQ